MSGGLVVSDKLLFHRLRRRLESIPESVKADRARMGEVFRSQYQSGGRGLEHLYLSRLNDARIYDDELGGLFTSVDDIIQVGRRRRHVTDALLAAAGPVVPADWKEMLATALPFLFPIVGGDKELLVHCSAAMKEAGVECGVYQIDLRRNMRAPQLISALLVPCHHDISPSSLDDMISIIARYKAFLSK
jgi:hypothetical protein